jgi:hypothetical protein
LKLHIGLGFSKQNQWSRHNSNFVGESLINTPAEQTFIAPVKELDFGRMAYTVIYVPKTVLRRLGVASRARVIGTVAGVRFRGAIIPAGGGRQYLLLSKKYLRSAGLAIGAKATVCLRLDDHDAVELVPEFARALSANLTAWRVWERMTPGAQRGYAHRVASAKREETRRARIEACIDELSEKSACD